MKNADGLRGKRLGKPPVKIEKHDPPQIGEILRAVRGDEFVWLRTAQKFRVGIRLEIQHIDDLPDLLFGVFADTLILAVI